MSTTTHTKNELDNVTVGFGITTILVIIFNAILTITKEMHSPLLAYMKSISIFGVKHHWLVHGLVIVVLFYLFGWLISKTKYATSVTSSSFLAKAIVVTTVVTSLGIFGFFLFELF